MANRWIATPDLATCRTPVWLVDVLPGSPVLVGAWLPAVPAVAAVGALPEQDPVVDTGDLDADHPAVVLRGAVLFSVEACGEVCGRDFRSLQIDAAFGAFFFHVPDAT